MAISKRVLSESTDGRNIKVVATGTPGTLIHTGSSDPTQIDQIELEACNTSTADVKLTLELGGVTSPDDLCEVTIPAESGFFSLGKHLIQGNATPLVVRAFAASANVINIRGQVNRISQ